MSDDVGCIEKACAVDEVSSEVSSMSEADPEDIGLVEELSSVKDIESVDAVEVGVVEGGLSESGKADSAPVVDRTVPLDPSYVEKEMDKLASGIG